MIIIIIFKNVRGCQSASFGMSSFGSYSDRSLFVDSVIFFCVNGYVSLLGTCQKLAGGRGGGRNFKVGFGNEVSHPCNGSEIC